MIDELQVRGYFLQDQLTELVGQSHRRLLVTLKKSAMKLTFALSLITHG